MLPNFHSQRQYSEVYTRVAILNKNLHILALFERLIFLIISGLKKLLAQYPALFVIDGDYVHVNSLQATVQEESNGSCGPGKRDYIQESKDYFKHKLLQYGIGTEVPIKCLLGHRSQASPQVRHISGMID